MNSWLGSISTTPCETFMLIKSVNRAIEVSPSLYKLYMFHAKMIVSRFHL